MAADPRTRQRLEKCWAMDFEFDLIPNELKEVSLSCLCQCYGYRVCIYTCICCHLT